MNSLTLDLSDADIANALKDCDTGEHVELTVGGTLHKNGKLATVALDSVSYTGSDKEGSPEEEAKESPAEEAAEDAGSDTDEPAPKKTPKAPKPKKNYPAALDDATSRE